MYRTITTQVLNVLIGVNEERIIIYRKAIKALKGTYKAPLRLYRCMISESLYYKAQLEEALKRIEIDANDKDEAIGNCVANISGGFPERISGEELSLCEVEEMVVQRAYKHALAQQLGYDILRMLREQQEELKISFGLVKNCTARQPSASMEMALS